MSSEVTFKATYAGHRFKGDVDTAVKDFSRIPDVLREAGIRYLEWAVDIVEGEVKKRLSFPSTSIDSTAPKGYLKRQTGEAASSINTRVDSAKMIGIVGGKPKYLAVHEGPRETTIRPKNAKWLTIPIEGALGKRARNIGRAGDYVDIEFHFPKKGSGKAPTAGVIRGGRYVPLFVLLKSVTIKPRAPFAHALGMKKKELGPELKRQIQEKLKEEY